MNNKECEEIEPGDLIFGSAPIYYPHFRFVLAAGADRYNCLMINISDGKMWFYETGYLVGRDLIKLP